MAPIHKVANRSGKFYSKDLKDYLGLSVNHKLILSTNAPDDYQEILWKNGAKMDFEDYGIDYWFPAHFSTCIDDSKMYQNSSIIRQIVHAKEVKSPFAWFPLSQNNFVEFREQIGRFSFVIFSTGQLRSRNDYKGLQHAILSADRLFPEEISFFFVGGRRRMQIPQKRIYHETNSSWLIRGLNGYSLSHKFDKSISRREILVNNLRSLLDKK